MDAKKELLTASECILKYGLDWKVISKPIHVDGEQLVNYQAIAREDTGYVFQVAKGRYEPVQNVEVFSFFDEIVKTGQAKYDSAGSYKNGAVVWIRAKLPYNFAPVPGDEVATYIRAITSHDGSTPVAMVPEVLRLICTNGLQALVEDETKRVSVKHTEHVRGRFLVNAERVLAKEIEYFKLFSERCKELAKQQMTRLEIDSFLHDLFNLHDKDEDNSTRVKNQVEEVNRLHANGIGSNIAGVRGTKWGIYNAVTEYIDKYRGTKGIRNQSGEADTALETAIENRAYASLLGSGKNLREKAFALLTH